MGTNFYLMTSSKDARDKYFGWNYELTDTPDWGYSQHIAKTSCGWLPLFDGSGCFESIKELHDLYWSDASFIIYDEYGTVYKWDEFEDRVLKFNGGIDGVAPKEKIIQDKNSQFYDSDMPEYKPISHFNYGHGKYKEHYYKDEDGYEFSYTTFG